MREHADLLFSFQAIARCGGITQASAQLGLAKSTVSGHLSRLEALYEVKLVQRSSRQFQLTAAGEKLHEHSLELVQLLNRTRSSLAEFSQQISGNVRITAPHASGNLLLPGLLQLFRRKYPAVTFELVLTNDTLDMLKNNIDVAFRATALDNSNLIARRLGWVRRILVASPEFLRSNPLGNGIAQLGDFPAIGYKNDQVWPLVNAHGNQLQLNIQPIVRVNGLESGRQLAIQGIGVALMPDYIAAESIKCKELVHLFDEWHGVDTPYHLVYPSRLSPSIAVKHFIDFTVEAFDTGAISHLLCRAAQGT